MAKRINLAQVKAHGYHEGALDFHGRQADVAAGSEEPSWAWSLDGADEAYLNAVGTDAICRAIDLPETAWDEIASEWCKAFCRGYRAAHAGRA